MDQIRRPDVQRPAKQQVRPPETHTAVSQAKRPSKTPWIVAAVAVVVLVAAIAWYSLAGRTSVGFIDQSKFQAILLTNGQWYFGKLEQHGSTYKLSKVFYIEQTGDNAEQENRQLNDQEIQLVKLGSEVHAPEDSMIIESEQLVFYENLKDSGKVATSISQFLEENS